MEENLLMTTAPRGMGTLNESIHSLKDCGWTGPLHLFSEPGTALILSEQVALVAAEPNRMHNLPGNVVLHQNEHLMGPVVNSYWALRFAIKDLPDRPTILLQDDIVCCKSARRKMEVAFEAGMEVVLGFAHEWNMKPEFNLFEEVFEGWQRWAPNKLLQDTFALNLQGALCVGFLNHDVLLKIVQCAHMAQHVIAVTTKDIPNRHWDNILFRSCASINMPVWMHVPSLVDHIGVESTIYPGRAINKRKGFNFNAEY